VIRTLSTRTVYENAWLTLREDEIERPDGSRGIYSVVDKHHGALVVALEDERVWLVGQFKYPLRRFSWEFPQGAIDDRVASPEETARTELAEETGLRAGRLERLGTMHYTPGLSSQAFDAWLATELEHGEPDPEPTEVGLEARPVDGATFRRMVADGEITDAATIAAWSLLAMRGTAL
jgi:8-oxo-dGTP pyrophosphatase MutT (NUDIX family)